MMLLFWLCLLLIMTLTLACFRAKLWIWTTTYGVILLVFSFFNLTALTTILSAGSIFLIFFLILYCRPLRRLLFTRYLFKAYQHAMPSISQTEKETLNAGEVGWERAIFHGNFNYKQLKSIQHTSLSQEEITFLEKNVAQLCSIISDWDINRQSQIPENIWQYLKKEGFFGLMIPKQFGGKAFSPLGYSQIVASIASMSTAIATVVIVPNSLGPAELLLHYGTDHQKQYYLPRLATGKAIPCFALTSPVAGSDASAMIDHGIVCWHEFSGEKQLAIRLNWDKRYITLSPVATLIGLAFKLYDPEHLLGNQENIGITCALIPTETPGVTTGRYHLPLHSAFPNGPTQGKDVLIPLNSIIGGVQNAGKGWHMLMEALAGGRGLSLPSITMGGAKKALYASSIYTVIRKQFHTSIAHFEGIQEVLAQMGEYAYLMEALRLFLIDEICHGIRSSIASAISKYHMTEMSRSMIRHAMDIHGGKGICMGPRNYLAQLHLESPISITVEGANILTRSMIIFGQGLLRCHPYLLKEFLAMKDPNPIDGLKTLDKLIFTHMGSMISHASRSFIFALSKGRLAKKHNHALKRYEQQFSQYAAAFALTTDMMALTMGGHLKKKESLSGRMADILSYLYMGAATIHYYEAHNDANNLHVAQASCHRLLYQMQESLYGVVLNLPSHTMQWFLRLLIFPFGKRISPLPDKQRNQTAHILAYDHKLRDQLSYPIHLDDSPQNPMSAMHRAWKQCMATAPLAKKLHAILSKENIPIKEDDYTHWLAFARKNQLLDQADYQALLSAFEQSINIIHVDHFSFEHLQTTQKTETSE